MSAILNFLLNHWFAISLIPVFWPLIVGPKSPANTTNRINQLVLLWLAIAYRDMFSKYSATHVQLIIDVWYHPDFFADEFVWMKRSILENLEQSK